VRLLYVTEAVPTRDPVLGDGSSMIPYELILAFPTSVEVMLLTFEGPAPVPESIQSRCSSHVVLRTRSPRGATLRALAGSYDVGGHARSTPEATARVAQLSGVADATLMHGPHVMPLVSHAVGPTVFQTVDPWSLRLRMEQGMVRGWRGWYRILKARQSLSRERRLPESVRLLTVGSRDAAEWSRLLGRSVRGIPNGVDVVDRTATRSGDPVICFVGSLNYAPNVVSAQVLVEKVAPQLWHSLPSLRFVIAGRQPSPDVLALAGDRVDVRPNVPSVADVFQGSDVAVFPDETGLGIRNSVREALAAGLPVVATPAAAREQEAHPRLHVEKSIDDVVARILELLSTPRRDPSPEVDVPSERSWRDVADEYLDELGTAMKPMPASGAS
jgi:glycosyltransferase involved in cell wall biosynthesis